MSNDDAGREVARGLGPRPLRLPGHAWSSCPSTPPLQRHRPSTASSLRSVRSASRIRSISPLSVAAESRPRGAGAVALNVTATNPTASSFLTVWPTGAPRPLASNLNFGTGQTVPNMVIVPVGLNGQISIYNNTGGVDVVVDVLGWFPTGNSYTGLTPARLMDTRPGSSTIDGQFAGVGAIGQAGSTNLTVVNRGGVPASGVGAVALNVTATNPTDRQLPHRLAGRRSPTAGIEPQLWRSARRCRTWSSSPSAPTDRSRSTTTPAASTSSSTCSAGSPPATATPASPLPA